jgi:hypothetical protein
LRYATATSDASGHGTISGTTKHTTLGIQIMIYMIETDAN